MSHGYSGGVLTFRHGKEKSAFEAELSELSVIWSFH